MTFRNQMKWWQKMGNESSVVFSRVSFKEIDHCRRQNWSRLRHLLKNHDASRIERSAHDCCNRPLNCGFVISFERREEKTVPWVNRTSLTRRMSPSKSWVGRNWALFVFVLANKVACLFSAVEEGLIMAHVRNRKDFVVNFAQLLSSLLVEPPSELEKDQGPSNNKKKKEESILSESSFTVESFYKNLESEGNSFLLIFWTIGANGMN